MTSRGKRFLKWTIWLLILGGGATAAVLYWRSREEKANAVPVETVTAKKGDLVLSVSAVGAVEPLFTVEIKPKASGEVKKVTVEEGDSVKKGALLVEIDPILEKRKLTQSYADLRIARAQLRSVRHKRRYAAAQLRRDSALLKKGLVSAESVDLLRREAAVLGGDESVAKAQILRAGEAMREARDRLAETKIYAPLDATVLERLVQPGQIVSSGTTTVTGGTTLLRLADLSRLFVRVKVDEADVAKITPKQEVTITADALAGRKFKGHVVRIAPQGKVENNVVVFDVLVEADAEGRKHLRPVMTANVRFVVSQRRGVVLLLARAIRRRSKGGRFVKLAGGGLRRVKTGLTDGKTVEVTSGLEAGEEVELSDPTKRGGRRRGMSGWRLRRTLGIKRR